MDTPNPSRQRKQLQRRTRREKRNRAIKANSTPMQSFMQGWGRMMSVPSEHHTNQRNKKSNRNRLSVKAKHKRSLAK